MSLYETLAATIKATELRCRSCGRRMPISRSDAARYFAIGWPVCHGETMTLESAEPARSTSDSPPDSTEGA